MSLITLKITFKNQKLNKEIDSMCIFVINLIHKKLIILI